MSSRSLLDSSPIRGTQTSRHEKPTSTRRSLKRTASTASLLLTPPQTVEQKRRSRSRHSSQSDRDTDVDFDSDLEDAGDDEERQLGRRVGEASSGRRVLFQGRKRQRTDRLDAVLASLSSDDAENPFWDGDDTATGDADDVDQERERSSSPPPAILFRNKAPVSPPPSRRQTSSVVGPAPSTPDGKTASASTKNFPIRDSPHNPFLADDEDDEDASPMSITNDLVEPHTPTDLAAEKPTISYVFRGVKTTFANPMYNLPTSAIERSLLPVEHPDFSPNPLCPPKVLFQNVISKRRKQRSTSPSSPTTAAARSVKAGLNARRECQRKLEAEWDEEGEDEEPLHVTPPMRLFVPETKS